MCACMLSCFSRVRFCDLWTIACQAPLSTGFSRQDYWSGLLCPPSADLPNPGIDPTSLTSPALADGFYSTSATWKASLSRIFLSKGQEKIPSPPPNWYKNNICRRELTADGVENANLFITFPQSSAVHGHMNSEDLGIMKIAPAHRVFIITRDISFPGEGKAISNMA